MSATSNVGHAFNTSKTYKRVWIAKCSESGINWSVEPYSEERGSAVFWLLHFLSLLLDGVSFLLSPGCSSSDVILNDFHSKLGRIHIRVVSPYTRGKHLFGIMGCTSYLCLDCITRARGCVYTTTCIQWDKATKSWLFKINTTFKNVVKIIFLFSKDALNWSEQTGRML